MSCSRETLLGYNILYLAASFRACDARTRQCHALHGWRCSSSLVILLFKCMPFAFYTSMQTRCCCSVCRVAVTWSSRMPNVAEPNLDANSPFSDSSWSTKAEDDKDRAAPITTASSIVRIAARLEGAWKTLTRICVPMPLPTGNANRVKANVHNTICSVPRPKAYFASACISWFMTTVSLRIED